MPNWEKTLAVATIRNNFVFGTIMELYPDLCRRLLEIILDVKVLEIKYPEREKTIEARIDGKGIRLDVYVEDADRNRWFDVEMQVTDSANLAKRMRYYQGLIDLDQLKRGQDYDELSESFIIFICPFDYFKQKRFIYTFRERCDQDTKLMLGDGATKIFLNTKGTHGDITPALKNFLDFVDSGIIVGAFVSELAKAVDSIKRNEKVRHDFMTLQMALLDERRATEKSVRESVALKMLNKGKPLEEIAELTDLPIRRIEELEKDNDNRDT